MSTSDMRKELESYGISTKSLLEKKEFVQALEQARAQGKQPINGDDDDKKQSAASETSSDAAGDSSSKSRSERIQEEMHKANTMKVGELKKELEARGIRTTSFFEKSEFTRAYAEAVVDNVSKKTSASQQAASQEEPLDPSYRDVTTQKFNARDPRLLSGVVIDVSLGR